MIIAVWIVSGITALLYLMAGGRKVSMPSEKLPENFPFVKHTGVRLLRVIGAVEVLGAIGLIVPVLTGIVPILTPIAASGLVLVMILAIGYHLRQREYKVIGFNVVLLVLPLFVAITRFAGVGA
jgi:uncharacterized membrane protein YphA (DoxX/SURF4 family)